MKHPLPHATRIARPKDFGLVVQELLDRLGKEQALKIALLELRKARRARSRQRFAFWEAVASQIRNEAPSEQEM